MELQSVKSSMIHSLFYDEDWNELYILFNSGRLYCYVDVSLKEYKGFLKVKSKGKYFYRHIRYTKIYYEVKGDK